MSVMRSQFIHIILAAIEIDERWKLKGVNKLLSRLVFPKRKQCI